MCKITPTLLAIRRNLSDDLLKPKYRKKVNRKTTSGHCYIAAEAMYHQLSEKQKEKYKPYYIKVNGDTHWYLMGITNNGTPNKYEILDPTYDQFTTLPNYSKGKRVGFLTKQPSKRTLILLNRIKSNGRTRREVYS